MSTPNPIKVRRGDFPKTRTHSISNITSILVATFNQCRRSPARMEELKAVLKFAYNKVVQYEKDWKEQEAAIEKAAKEQAEAAAAAEQATTSGDDK